MIPRNRANSYVGMRTDSDNPESIRESDSWTAVGIEIRESDSWTKDSYLFFHRLLILKVTISNYSLQSLNIGVLF